MPKRIAVIGAGSWGSALAVMLARRGHDVAAWDVDAQVIADIRDRHRNDRYLPGVAIPHNATGEYEAAAAVRSAAVVVFAVPASGVAAAVREVCPHACEDACFVSATKGLCPVTGRQMTQIIASEGGVELDRIVAISGPNLALEVCAGIPTATVAAGLSRARMEEVRDVFTGPEFRVYTNPDVTGVQLGGALKNVLAIGAGINDGLGFGDNTKATLLTRGLAEMTRLGVALGARPETFRGLSGVGDLIATSVSAKSRNYRVGYGLGQGRDLSALLTELGQVAEGVPTARAVQRLADEHGVDVPITRAICSVLYDGVSPRDAVALLMSRAPRDEFDEPFY